ncbi:MAG: glutamyl-tRNA reductase [Planctomycetaceae bacterium]|nr:glutamyl-tRNA reductase [Planctomycetaceae bacterium]
MKLVVIGASHHLTPLDIRERLAIPKSRLPEVLQGLQLAVPSVESVLLSTCNRTEWYVAAPSDQIADAEGWIVDCFARQAELTVDQLQPYLFQLADQAATEHLFRVASSLDSMVIGESQIISQVREAYDEAAKSQRLLPAVHSWFQKAVAVAKAVATETALHRHRVSVPSVAISGFAADIFETLTDKRILLIGAGQIAEETLVYLRDHGVRSVHLVNRTASHATELAERFDGTAHPWDDLTNQIQMADLVVSTTGSTHQIVDLATFQKLYQKRRQRPLLVLDLAIPRDFEPGIADLPNVYLYTIDDLKAQCQRNLRMREKELPKAEELVRQHVARFQQEWNLRHSVPAIQQLRDRTDEIKQEELTRLLNKIPDLTPDLRKELEIAFDRLVNKILHRPLTSLRAEAKSGQPQQLADSLKRLFQLND